jgi:murein DD-endopeptidase MepM/ murein hydrolase activator NlpD
MTRVVAVAAGVLGVFLAGATQVPSHVRLPVATVVPGAVVTQPFGCTSLELEPFDASCPTHHTHTGIDLAAAAGTDVHAATGGRALTGYDPLGAGNFVAVVADSHVRILYCHLQGFAVRSGDRVEAGQVLGWVGATGLATGPHVHLQVDVDGVPVDPAIYLGS